MVGIADNPEMGFFLLYIIVVILTVIVFQLGFARKLPLLKMLIVYIALLVGSVILTFLAMFIPIAEGLIVAAIVLIIYRIRLHQTKKKEQSSK
ncbi:YlaH-like family protein [Bacillaceae bacterium YX66]